LRDQARRGAIGRKGRSPDDFAVGAASMGRFIWRMNKIERIVKGRNMNVARTKEEVTQVTDGGGTAS